MTTDTLTAEDLRQKIAERVPGAYRIVADAMNLTPQQLNDKLFSGAVSSIDVIADMARVINQLKQQVEIARAERDRARYCYDQSSQLIVGIHNLLYPPPVTGKDGQVFVFKGLDDPHAHLQLLSDRIRALPDELAKQTQG
jgi:hypothetical protein